MEIPSVSYEELQGFLKTSTLVIAILRNIFHLFTTSAATFFYFSAECSFHGECLGGGGWLGVFFVIVFAYFLADIVSLPQDIYYIWATTSSDLDLSSSLA